MRTSITTHRNLAGAASLLLSTEAPFLLPVLVAALVLMLAGRLSAQTFTVLHTFTASNTNSLGVYTNIDGPGPSCGLILSGNTLYGTAEAGGSSGTGAVFKVNIDGTDFTTLYSFTLGSDGGRPYAGLILCGNTLYGTAECGGAFPGNGTVFALNTDGTAFTTLHTFTAIINSFPPTPYNNSDGANPYAGLILSGNTLYGAAFGGGDFRRGTVFAVNTNGTGFTTRHAFTGGSDGASPYAGLILSGNTLYGTARLGGGLDNPNNGMIFKVNTDGTGFATLHAFTGGSDGAYPYAGLILSSNTLYGTASGGGSSGNGTVFSLSLGSVRTPQLTIIRSVPDVILTWPTNATGFTLHSTTNLTSSSVWTAVSPDPVVMNGQNTVTNPISATQQFFRLSQ